MKPTDVVGLSRRFLEDAGVVPGVVPMALLVTVVAAGKEAEVASTTLLVMVTCLEVLVVALVVALVPVPIALGPVISTVGTEGAGTSAFLISKTKPKSVSLIVTYLILGL